MKHSEKRKPKLRREPKGLLAEICRYGNSKVRYSAFIMGLGQIMYGQWAKGLMFMAIQIAVIIYFILFGAEAIAGFFTLGTVEANPWFGIEGDNSIDMMIFGILSFIILGAYVMVGWTNVKDVYQMQKAVERGKPTRSLTDDAKDLLDKNFYKAALFFPVAGVCLFHVLPVIFMILIAFTNYGGDVMPPKLVDWTGFESFRKVLTLTQFSSTFFKLLTWNILWAVLSTFINYFGGLALALLYNKKCVKGKAFFRVFPVLAMAIPGFITLLAFKFMFSYGGPINQMIVEAGGKAIGFLDLDAGWRAKMVGLFVNSWLSIPSFMLYCTGIMSNLNQDMYEAARIDGANAFQQFTHLTLPFVLFTTAPLLITQFVGNFNNFGIFFFMRGGLYSDGYFLASDSDLLINWLYNLSIENNYYSIGAAISLIIFLITSGISLTVYIMSPSYRQEDTYK